MKRSSWILLTIPILVVLAVMLTSHYGRKLQHKSYISQEKQFKEKLASYPFVDIEDSTSLRQQIQNQLDSSDAGLLTQNERIKLANRVFQMLLAYHNGTFDSYARFKYPPDMNDERYLDKGWISAYREGLHDFNLPFSTQARLLGAGGWDAVTDANPGEVLKLFYQFTEEADALQTNTIVCHTCWSQVSLPQMQVVVHNSQSRLLPFTSVFAAGETFGIVAKPCGDGIIPNPKEMFKKHQTVLSAYVRVVVKSANPDACFPILVQFYWVNGFADWIPYQFAKGLASLKMEHIF